MTAAQPSRSTVTRIQHPESVAPRTRRRARTSTVSSRSLRAAGTAVAVTSALLLTAYIGEYARVAKTSHKRAELRAELRRAQQENTNLHAQVQILERPDRIDSVARKIGMEQRSEADYVALAPLPPAASDAGQTKPILAGFLPERWTNLLGKSR